MNRQDIRLLQQMRGYPALTITLPTYPYIAGEQTRPGAAQESGD
ncbi:MAG TPA: hypothetical protein P5211_01870 [Anaerolineae bacterium]|nr:hypothetical protein [Anaerolineae bacterium]HRT31146.1 hypothetical protein [Anaerolineae bacterium]HXK43363.1 hypothetical protein [Anaerolineae bacterium]